jgi:hypothetical protein
MSQDDAKCIKSLVDTLTRLRLEVRRTEEELLVRRRRVERQDQEKLQREADRQDYERRELARREEQQVRQGEGQWRDDEGLAGGRAWERQRAREDVWVTKYGKCYHASHCKVSRDARKDDRQLTSMRRDKAERYLRRCTGCL